MAMPPNEVADSTLLALTPATIVAVMEARLALSPSEAMALIESAMLVGPLLVQVEEKSLPLAAPLRSTRGISGSVPRFDAPNVFVRFVR